MTLPSSPAAGTTTGSAARSATASANSNIALIKYWGKADPANQVPTTSSLSLTLGGTRTSTTVAFDGGADGDDVVLINGSEPWGTARDRVVRFMDLVRERAGVTERATVSSVSTVPLAAGLASSAAGFAALAAAASRAAGLELDDADLSRLARRGSGSATRSVFGGLAVWHAGTDDATSYAEAVPGVEELDLAMVVITLETGRKSISSSRAMQATMTTSPLYPAWVEASAKDLEEALVAVAARDLPRLGAVAEGNALGMHAAMAAARPAILYWLPGTVEAIHAVAALREEGLPAWVTIDAGPNVKVITTGARAEEVAAALRDRLSATTVSVRRPGGGVRYEQGAE